MLVWLTAMLGSGRHQIGQPLLSEQVLLEPLERRANLRFWSEHDVTRVVTWPIINERAGGVWQKA